MTDDNTSDFRVEVAMNASNDYEFDYEDVTHDEAYDTASKEAVQAFLEDVEHHPEAYLTVVRVDELDD